MEAPRFPENQQKVAFLGRELCFSRQTAAQQLALPALALELAARLASQGLEGRAGFALAHNCALLWQTLRRPGPPPSPEGMLEWFSVGQIAQLCRLCQRGWEGQGDFEAQGEDEEGWM